MSTYHKRPIAGFHTTAIAVSVTRQPGSRTWWGAVRQSSLDLKSAADFTTLELICLLLFHDIKLFVYSKNFNLERSRKFRESGVSISSRKKLVDVSNSSRKKRSHAIRTTCPRNLSEHKLLSGMREPLRISYRLHACPFERTVSTQCPRDSFRAGFTLLGS